MCLLQDIFSKRYFLILWIIFSQMWTIRTTCFTMRYPTNHHLSYPKSSKVVTILLNLLFSLLLNNLAWTPSVTLAILAKLWDFEFFLSTSALITFSGDWGSLTLKSYLSPYSIAKSDSDCETFGLCNFLGENLEFLLSVESSTPRFLV